MTILPLAIGRENFLGRLEEFPRPAAAHRDGVPRARRPEHVALSALTGIELLLMIVIWATRREQAIDLGPHTNVHRASAAWSAIPHRGRVYAASPLVPWGFRRRFSGWARSGYDVSYHLASRSPTLKWNHAGFRTPRSSMILIMRPVLRANSVGRA
ncbi:hypothetical protein B0H14DRAFT_2588128 [Mycena olivaceomarginata]|nr:hypothetical protein B0H14DRAFT_2588128 [Mycena olivaceomarginata]